MNVFNDPVRSFDEALLRHLGEPSEQTRYDGYELGRQAVGEQAGLIGAIEAVARLLVTEIGRADPHADPAQLIGAVTEFMADYLAPFELLLSGTKHALRQLQSSHDDLTAANAELAAAKLEAEHATRAKASFLASMSHEIRTPLNGIVGMTSLLADSGLDADQREAVEIVKGSSEHLLTIINQILDFSKIDAGSMELELVRFELTQVLLDSLEIVAPLAQGKGLELLYVTEPDVPEALIGDQGRLRQVLVNLLSNAVKFTETGEVTVTVSARSRPPGGARLRFDVDDSGIGIAADALPSIFEPFSQADLSTTRIYGGSGLGLAISRRLVELMGGEIRVASSPGAGSTFSFTIELQTLASEAAPAPDALRGRRILVIDDHAANRRMIGCHAAALGVDTTEAGSLTTALQAVAGGARFDAILVDHRLPEIDSAELAQVLAGTPGGRRTPFVLLAPAGHQSRNPVFAAAIQKPVRPHALRAALLEVLSAEPPAAPARPRFDATLAKRHPLTILVADDSSINQRVAAAMLKRMGYEAGLANDGQEVLELLAQRRFDLVLLDVHMPRLDGLAAARHITATIPEAERPWLVALTADVTDEQRRACLEAGMDDYLEKPIAVEALAAAIERASAERRA